MKTNQNSEKTEIKKQKEELLKLVLKKTGTSMNELVSMAKEMYVAANINVVTSYEKKNFPNLAF